MEIINKKVLVEYDAIEVQHLINSIEFYLANTKCLEYHQSLESFFVNEEININILLNLCRGIDKVDVYHSLIARVTQFYNK